MTHLITHSADTLFQDTTISHRYANNLLTVSTFYAPLQTIMCWVNLLNQIRSIVDSKPLIAFHLTVKHDLPSHVSSGYTSLGTSTNLQIMLSAIALLAFLLYLKLARPSCSICSLCMQCFFTRYLQIPSVLSGLDSEITFPVRPSLTTPSKISYHIFLLYFFCYAM